MVDAITRLLKGSLGLRTAAELGEKIKAAVHHGHDEQNVPPRTRPGQPCAGDSCMSGSGSMKTCPETAAPAAGTRRSRCSASLPLCTSQGQNCLHREKLLAHVSSMRGGK